MGNQWHGTEKQYGSNHREKGSLKSRRETWISRTTTQITKYTQTVTMMTAVMSYTTDFLKTCKPSAAFCFINDEYVNPQIVCLLFKSVHTKKRSIPATRVSNFAPHAGETKTVGFPDSACSLTCSGISLQSKNGAFSARHCSRMQSSTISFVVSLKVS